MTTPQVEHSPEPGEKKKSRSRGRKQIKPKQPTKEELKDANSPMAKSQAEPGAQPDEKKNLKAERKKQNKSKRSTKKEQEDVAAPSIVRHYLQFEKDLQLLTQLQPCSDLLALLRPTEFLAIDCEMITTKANRNMVARCSVVNEYGTVILDAYVEPPSEVLDYRTRWSGITPEVLQQARNKNNLYTFESLKKIMDQLVYSHTIVGHAVHGDLKVLGYHDTRDINIIDTQKLPRFGQQCGLKRLMSSYFNIQIQADKVNGHSSVEDASASMLLFRTFRSEFLKK